MDVTLKDNGQLIKTKKKFKCNMGSKIGKKKLLKCIFNALERNGLN